MNPVKWQRVEAAAVAIAIIVGMFVLDFGWWWLLALFLVFDLSALGFLANPKVGAVFYNAVHNYAGPALLVLIYFATDASWVALVAMVWAFHVAVDRALGYGLKYEDDFQHTHLGWIGKRKSASKESSSPQ
ncbi:DUF4260 domain-containing protein [Demequina aurantiaca]|uniref:DUF4260 domain-containing protein n=1 Tax=Demequina aurantiaca TaxID=676200 RepID=UPI000783A3AC|nr:DUF4260 domain-containing protein [Demequina aurantiaca]